MTRFPRTLLLPLLVAAISVHAAGLPDTGQDTCYNDAGADAASIANDAGSHPRQDCRYGRDPAAAAGVLTKTGAGAKGFDYTKIANNGSTLAADATLGESSTDWACTKDNITGLTWEVKAALGNNLRYAGHTYAWFNADGGTNGGNVGSAGGNTCNGTLPGNECNTQAFVAAVNAAALCTYADWRLPTRRELQTLVYADGSNPSIDPTYFPNTPASSTVFSFFWSGSSYVPIPLRAWAVLFLDGYTDAIDKSLDAYVRLVRGGQF